MDVVTVLLIYCNVSPDEYYTKSFESKMPLSVCFLLALYIYIYIEEERDAVGQRKINKEKLACSRT